MKIYNLVSVFLLSGLFLATSCTDDIGTVPDSSTVPDPTKKDALGSQTAVPDSGPTPGSKPVSGTEPAAKEVEGHKWHPVKIEALVPPFLEATQVAKFTPAEDKIIGHVKGNIKGTNAIALRVQKVSDSTKKKDIDKDGQASKFFIIFNDGNSANATLGLDSRVHGRNQPAMAKVPAKGRIPTEFSVEDVNVVTDKSGDEYFMVTLKDLTFRKDHFYTLIGLKNGKAHFIPLDSSSRKNYSPKKPVVAEGDLPGTGEMRTYTKELNAPAGKKVMALGNDKEAYMIVDDKEIFIRKAEKIPSK